MTRRGILTSRRSRSRSTARHPAAVNCGTLVNLGGDIAVAGEPPDQGWLVGIVDNQGFDGAAAGPEAGPEAEAGAAGACPPRHDTVVTIRSGGLATSSTKVRAWSRGAARLHHIIEPSTGMPANSCWRTVSVAAATCVAANTASTAAIIRSERAPGWLASQHLPARLAGRGGEIVPVAGWPADPTGEGSHA